MNNKTFGQRVHAWLIEPDGETFRLGKWRFWFVAVAGLQLLNAGLTALIFDSTGNLQNYMGAILLGVGALVGWIAIGCLHYSDSGDRRLARGVSALDSVTLLFVIAHFAFLMWTYGHMKVIQGSEAKYELQAEKYNAEARQVQASNEKIAEALAKVAEADKQRAKIENDTAYQLRKATEGGAKIMTRAGVGVTSSLSTSPVALAKPPDPPKESSAAFLTRWDSWIRAANFGELLLAALTLIFIRNQTARTNTASSSPFQTAPILSGVRTRAPVPVAPFAQTHVSSVSSVSSRQARTQTQTHASFNPEGLRLLRETLRDIAFGLHNLSFKVDVRGNAVWIRMMEANQGTQQTVASAKAKIDILDDAMTMQRDAFRNRLENFLRGNSFNV